MINFKDYEFFYDPFPHCILNNFLNLDEYNEICREFPKNTYLKVLEEKKKNDLKKFNKFNLSNANKETISNFNKFINSTTTTKKFYKYINSDNFLIELDSFLKEKFVDLKLEFKVSKNLIDLFNSILKKKRRIDFEFSSIPLSDGFILPHTDGSDKLIGFVIPVIDNDEIFKAKNLGTKIYKAVDNQYKFNYFNKTVPLEKVEEIKELPFKKNQMSLHVKTFNSLHGVGPINNNKFFENQVYRKSISIFLLK
jgi:hypothetical protein